MVEGPQAQPRMGLNHGGGTTGATQSGIEPGWDGPGATESGIEPWWRDHRRNPEWDTLGLNQVGAIRSGIA